MMKTMWTLALSLLVFVPENVWGQTAGYWMWVLDKKAPLTSRFCDSQPIIIVGRLVDVQEAERVKVYNASVLSFTGARIYTIRVEEVLKGSGLIPFEEIPVVILPYVSDAVEVSRWPSPPVKMTRRQILAYYQRTGKLPPGIDPQHQSYPEIPMRQRRVFFLFPADFQDPTGNMLWAGVEELPAGRQYYGYRHSVRGGEKQIEVVKRYLKIEAIGNQEKRIRRLAVYSLRLLREATAPEEVVLGAVHNLGGIHTSWVWGRVTQRLGSGRVIVGPASRFTAVYLSDAEMNELVQMATDRSRSTGVRDGLLRVFKELKEYAHRPFRPGPFLRILQDRSEDPDVRWNAIFLLEQVGGPEVHKAFRDLLLTEPKTDSERTLCNRLRNSPILKTDQ